MNCHEENIEGGAAEGRSGEVQRGRVTLGPPAPLNAPLNRQV